MPNLLGKRTAQGNILGRNNFSPATLAFLSVPANIRPGGTYTVSVFGVGTDISLAQLQFYYGGRDFVTVNSSDGTNVSITIWADIPLKFSQAGYQLSVLRTGVGQVYSTPVPYLPPAGWSFTDLVNPLPSTDDRSLTHNMVNQLGAAINAVTGDQAVYQAPLVVDPDGKYGVDRDGFPPTGPISAQAYIIEADGTIGQTATKTIIYQDGADNTPSAFTFTPAPNSPLEQWIVSNAITVQSVDPGLDIPVSITNGEYQVSTNGGTTWGAFTAANTNVQLNYQIRVRVFTADAYATPETATLTVGGVSANFVATTALDPALEPVITVDAVQFPEDLLIHVIAEWNNFQPTRVEFYRIEGASGGARVLFASTSGDLDSSIASFESMEFIQNSSQRRYVAVATYGNNQQIESAERLITIQKPVSATLTGPAGVRTGPFNILLTLDGPMTDLGADSFVITGFPVSATYQKAFTGSGQSYVLSITPPANFAGPVAITLPAGSGQDALLLGTYNSASVTVQVDTTQVITNPRILSIGGDNIVTPGETVTIAVQDITLANIDQVVLAGNAGEYAIPFNGSAQVVIPTFIPAGTYTLKLREFA